MKSSPRASSTAMRLASDHSKFIGVRYTHACGYNQAEWCGDRVMETTLIVMDTDAELARARGPVDRLTASDKPADLARLAAQARPTAALSRRGRTPRIRRSIGTPAALLESRGLRKRGDAYSWWRVRST